MAVTCRPVEIETGSQDRHGMLVFDGERLLAILVRLSDLHNEHSGAWYLEYGLALQPTEGRFESLDRALAWIEKADRTVHSGP